MKIDQITTSAALFFGCEEPRSIPPLWLERARELFAQYDLSPILFTASGGDFLLDDCYVLAQAGGAMDRWGEVFAARGSDLATALSACVIGYLDLDSPRASADDRGDWRAAVCLSVKTGRIYVGVDEDLIPDPSALLRRAYNMAKGLFDVRYGIAYKLPLAQNPDCYASGFVTSSVSEVFEMIRHRDQWGNRKKNPVELWGDELNGRRRHLAGLFRGAYPASILSESHIQTAALLPCEIGNLSELDASLWLWELSDRDLPAAEEFLKARAALFNQAGTT